MDHTTLLAAASNAPLIFVLSAFACFFIGFFYAFLGKPRPKPFLNKSIQKIQLIDKTPITHNSWRLRFQLPSKQYCLGLPVGKHIKVYCPNVPGSVKGNWNGKLDPEASEVEIERKYTPVTGDEFLGFVDFVIKVYQRGSMLFPDGGKASQYIGSLEIGDYLKISGPIGMLTYNGYGQFLHGKRELSPKKSIGMVAGGTGITPMLQVLRKSLMNPRDNTEFWLLYANRTPQDILLREVLEELATLHPKQLHLWYTVDTLSEREAIGERGNGDHPGTCQQRNPDRDDTHWKYSVGLITVDLLRDHLPMPSPDALVLLCGPPPMVHNACRPNLLKLGWNADDILEF